MNIKIIIAACLSATLTSEIAQANLKQDDYATTLDSKFIAKTLALQTTDENIFVIDKTLEYFRLDNEQDLFRRHVKRIRLENLVNNKLIDKSITAKQAIEMERTSSVGSLITLRKNYYEKFADVALIPDGESPWLESYSEKYILIAPSLWTYRDSWGKPGAYVAYQFVIKLNINNIAEFGEYSIPSPRIEIAMDDGRHIEFECSRPSRHESTQYGLDQHRGDGLLFAVCSDNKWLSEKVISIVNDLAAGKGQFKARFTPAADSEKHIWLNKPKIGDMDLINFRVKTNIEQATCSDRGNCFSYYKKHVIYSIGHWLSSYRNLSLTAFLFGLISGGAILSVIRRISPASLTRIAMTLSAAIIIPSGLFLYALGTSSGSGWGGLILMILAIAVCAGLILGVCLYFLYYSLKEKRRINQLTSSELGRGS